MLAPLTEELIASCCPPTQRQAVSDFLSANCARDLPGIGSTPEWIELIDRIQLAAIRGSNWNLETIAAAVKLANLDWRDLLVAAGFANDLSSHRLWQKNALAIGNVS